MATFTASDPLAGTEFQYGTWHLAERIEWVPLWNPNTVPQPAIGSVMELND